MTIQIHVTTILCPENSLILTLVKYMTVQANEINKNTLNILWKMWSYQNQKCIVSDTNYLIQVYIFNLKKKFSNGERTGANWTIMQGNSSQHKVHTWLNYKNLNKTNT